MIKPPECIRKNQNIVEGILSWYVESVCFRFLLPSAELNTHKYNRENSRCTKRSNIKAMDGFMLTFAFAVRIMEKTQCKLFTFGSRIYGSRKVYTDYVYCSTLSSFEIIDPFIRTYMDICVTE